MNTLVMSLLLSCALGAPIALSSARTEPLQQEDEAFQALEKEYDRVALEWRSQVRAAKKADDAAAEEALLARNPVKEYYPKFAALADNGSALASLWAATRVEDVETDAAVVKTRKASLFPRAIAGLAATGEAKDLLKELSKQDEFLDPQTLEGFFADFAKATKDEELGAKALHERAKSMMERAARDEDRAKAIAALEEIVETFPKSKAAQAVEGMLYEFKNLSVGCVAPDFSTEDVDGAAFKLSDYRGKVVLIDFWGFW